MGKASEYIINEGYRMVYRKKDGIYKNFKWNKIWNSDGLPKVNFFFWILAQRKDLTAENQLLMINSASVNLIGVH